jgi:hypothetical protein
MKNEIIYVLYIDYILLSQYIHSVIMDLLPYDMLQEIIGHLCDLDRQIMRRVCAVFTIIISYKEIDFNDTYLEIEHVRRYEHFWDNVNDKTLKNLIKHDLSDAVLYMQQKGGFTLNKCKMVYAAEYGSLKCLKLLHSIDYDIDSFNFYISIDHEDLCFNQIDGVCKCLDRVIMNMAVHTGNIECLKFLHEEGYKWDLDAASVLAVKGSLEGLKWLKSIGPQGGPYDVWDSHVVAAAAQAGQLECLIYAHQNGCELTLLSSSWAGSNGHLGCLKYLISHGCPWVPYMSDIEEYPDIISYALELKVGFASWKDNDPWW